MIHDPVVEEMRKHGASIAEQCAGDVHRMAERFRCEQDKSGHRIVRRKDRNRFQERLRDKTE